MSKEKKIIVLSDLHCGSLSGLTPPRDMSYIEGQPNRRKLLNFMWKNYLEYIEACPEPYLVVVNGDILDGSGQKSAGSEQLTTDRIEQAEMAYRALKLWKPKNGFVMTFGTAFHTGTGEDFERHRATRLEAEFGYADIKGQQWLDIDGLMFNIRHHHASSGVPSGRANAILKTRMWDQIWAKEGENPESNVYIRSHCHYYQFAGGPGWVGMSTPALQAAESKYGRRLENLVDFGMIELTVQGGELIRWVPRITRLTTARSKVVKR